MSKTKIEWATDTWNPVTGCSKVSPGCDSCYALTMSRRLAAMGHPKYQGVVSGKDWTGEVHCQPKALEEPLSWKKPRRIFVCSMSDLFHSKVPFEFIVKVFDIMAATSWHTYLVLTKRPGRMAHFAEHIWSKQGGYWDPISARLNNLADEVPDKWPGTAWPSNVWAGTSVESQKYAPRLDILARVPAKVRFVSYEPALGPVNLRQWLFPLRKETDPLWRCDKEWPLPPLIQWCIAGGESGPGARPAHPDWFRWTRDDCQAAGVAFFMKQRGEWSWEEEEEDDGIAVPINWKGQPHRYRFLYPNGTLGTGYDGTSGVFIVKVGKKAAGALLDGREWREFPA